MSVLQAIASCTWVDTTWKVETQLHKITEQDAWLKRWLLPQSLIWFWLIWIWGTLAIKWAPNIGNYLVYNSYKLPGLLCFLKIFKSMFITANHQANDLPKSGRFRKEMKRMANKTHVNLKSWSVNAVRQKIPWGLKATKGINKRYKSYRAAAESSATWCFKFLITSLS